jgi:replication-associated recombination protein RarA
MQSDQDKLSTEAPLAARMLPRTLDEFIGQAEIVGPGSEREYCVFYSDSRHLVNCLYSCILGLKRLEKARSSTSRSR